MSNLHQNFVQLFGIYPYWQPLNVRFTLWYTGYGDKITQLLVNIFIEPFLSPIIQKRCAFSAFRFTEFFERTPLVSFRNILG